MTICKKCFHNCEVNDERSSEVIYRMWNGMTQQSRVHYMLKHIECLFCKKKIGTL